MTIEQERLVVGSEHPSRVWIERSTVYQLVDGGAPLKSRVDADKRLRPEPVGRVQSINLMADVVGSDRGERAGKPLVVADQRPVEIKDVQYGLPQQCCASLG